MLKTFLRLFCLCLMILASAQGAEAGKEATIAVEAEASVPYIENGLLATKEQALAAAQRAALEQALGLYVSGQTVVEKARLIDDRIFSRTAGYLKSWKILSERRDGEFYVMKISADVKLGNVKEDLDMIGLLLQQAKVANPRLMLKIEVLADGEPMENDWVENVMGEVLLSKGYQLVDRDQLEQIKAEGRFASFYDLKPEDLAKYGKSMDAELMVLGKAKAVETTIALQKKMGMVAYRADLTVRVVKTSTGQEILRDQEGSQLPKVDVTNEAALNKALDPISKSLAGRLAAKIAETLSQSDNVFVINFHQIKGMQEVKALTEDVRTMEGVTNFQLRTMEGGNAQFELRHKYASAQVLASRMEKLPRVKVKVTGVTGQGLDINFEEVK